MKQSIFISLSLSSHISFARAICSATSIAASMLASLAAPVPAMSKAVPWSTEVRMIGRPS